MATYYGANWRYNKPTDQREALRVCECCGEEKPLKAYRLADMGGYVYKRVKVCEDCEGRAAEAATEPAKEQKCPVCHEVKPIECFKNKKGVITMTCRHCLDTKGRNALKRCRE